MHYGDDNDRLRIRAIEDTVGKPSEQSPARVAVDDLIELRIFRHALEGRVELGPEFVPQPPALALVPLEGVLDVGRRAAGRTSTGLT
jgi:hypothetical protein